MELNVGLNAPFGKVQDCKRTLEKRGEVYSSKVSTTTETPVELPPGVKRFYSYIFTMLN
jgi:hypothetical protein